MANILVSVAIVLQLLLNLGAGALWQPNIHPPQQSTTVEIKADPPIVDFDGKTITFPVQLINYEPGSKVFIYLLPEGRDPAFYPLEVSPEGRSGFVFDFNSAPIRVFTQIKYSFRIELLSGDEINSPEYWVEFTDSRFDWKSLKNSAFEIFYYNREIDFGQTALNTAASGLEEAYKLVPVRPGKLIRVYIYRDPRDLQEAQQGLQPWVAGHAAPDLSMVLISIPSGPEQRLELERQLPHELVHILQYQAFGDRARDLPVWLLEGSASVAEFYQNPEYASVLRSSAEQDRLLSFESLCDSFPRDASGVFLAYAQSQSFVRYLLDRSGSSQLKVLFQKYADGMSCTAGFEAAYETSLAEAEYRWRLEALGINPAALVIRNLMPYLLFLLIVFGAAAVTMLFAARKRRSPETL